MDQATLVAKARRYWEMWLPRKTKELKDAGEFDAAIQIAAVRAHAEIVELIVRGYRECEAIELALPKYIFLKPELHE
jgi:hypothetical protein